MLRQSIIRERWGVIATCSLATSAVYFQAPLWLFHQPPNRAFNLGWVEINLLVSLTTLPGLAFVLLGGVLGDFYGRRRVLLVGLGGLIGANLLLAITPALPWFLTTNLAAGLFGALVLPLSLSLLTLAFADDARAKATALAAYLAVTTTAFFLSMVAVPIVFAMLDFRAVFVAPTMLALVAIPLVRQQLVESRCTEDRRFDAVGHAAWVLVLLSVIYGLKLWSVADKYVLPILAASLIGCALGLAVLFWRDRRVRGSALEQRAVPRRRLAALVACGMAMQFALVGYATQVRGVLIAGYGFSPLLGTVALAPLALGMLAMVLVGTGRLEGLRVRPTLALGLAMAGIVALVTAVTHAADAYAWLAVLLFVFGMATIACNTAWTFTFLSAIDDRMIGVRTGISGALFELGSLAGGTVAGALLATIGLAEAARRLREQGVPPVVLEAALASLNTLLDAAATDPTALDSALAQRLMAAYRLVYIASYEQVLLIIAAVCLMASIAAWRSLRARTTTEELTLARER
jgi:DHA2 family multidrug resistance protein-like MFS transporter